MFVGKVSHRMTHNKTIAQATFTRSIASNYGGIIAMFLMPAVATGEERIEFTVNQNACAHHALS
jgi:hypothetical protein